MLNNNAPSLTPKEKAAIITAFNNNGLVLDFSDSTFRDFTINSIGCDLKAAYGSLGKLSKGKSLEKFVDEEKTDKVIKLTSDLLEYYKENIHKTKPMPDSISDYVRIKPIPPVIIEQLEEMIQKYTTFENSTIKKQAISIKNSFNDSYINKQIDQMIKSIERNPSDAIGKAKELLEACLKSILSERNTCQEKELSRKDIPELIKNVRQELGIDSDHKEIKQIIGGLSSISGGLAQLRNSKGSGHGRVIKTFEEPSPIEARLAADSSIALIHFFWKLHKNKIKR